MGLLQAAKTDTKGTIVVKWSMKKQTVQNGWWKNAGDLTTILARQLLQNGFTNYSQN